MTIISRERKDALVHEFAMQFNISHHVALAYLISEEWDYFAAATSYRVDNK